MASPSTLPPTRSISSPTLTPLKKTDSSKHVGLISGGSYNLNRAIDSTPTAVMRTELTAAGVAIPDDEGLTALAIKYNAWIEQYKHDSNLPPSATWYSLFAELDKDGDGMITFDELLDVTRAKLNKKEGAMPLTTIKAMWCALDNDDSDQLHKDEVATFIRKGMQSSLSSKAKGSPPLKKHDSSKHVGMMSADRVNVNRALDSTPTVVMRTELTAAGVEPLDDAAMTSLAIQYNGWLEQYKHDNRKPKAATWYMLFAELDKDGDGMITFDELVDVTRSKLRRGEKAMPLATIKAMWCALDNDDSNQIHKDEISGWIRRGMQSKSNGRSSAVSERNSSSTRSPMGSSSSPPTKPSPLKRHDSSSHVGAISSDRVGVGRALDAQPTKEMLEELEQSGVPIPNDVELTALSMKLNSWIEWYRYEQKMPPSASWYNLFKVIDKDGSGFVTFDELQYCVRRLLNKGKGEISDLAIKALWCALDTNADNSLHKDEMGGFFKLGMVKDNKKQKQLTKQKTSQNLVSPIERVGMSEALETQSTADMRKELRAAGIALPTDAELIEYSEKLNAWIEAYRYDQKSPPSYSWFNLFKEVDADGNGAITFDELTTCVRRELKKGPNVISHNELRALWCALDESGDNLVDKDEAAGFFKLGQQKKRSSPSKPTGGGGDDDGGEEGLVCTPTSEMRRDLELAGEPSLSEADLTALSLKLNGFFEDYRHEHKLPPTHSWHALFMQCDADASGTLTFDELTTCVRRELKKGPRAMPHSELKALWIALDADSSDHVDEDEMTTFLARGGGVPPPKKKKWGGVSGVTKMLFGGGAPKYAVAPAPSELA